MARRKEQTIEIDKTHRNPLPSFRQAVTPNYSDVLGAALYYNQKISVALPPGSSMVEHSAVTFTYTVDSEPFNHELELC